MTELPISDEEPKNSSNKFLNYWLQFRQIVQRNKVISLVLAVVLIFGFYKVIAPKIPVFNSLTCSSLKKELNKIDITRKKNWDDYQSEVSRLGQIDQFADYGTLYVNQVGNVSRRLVQFYTSNIQGFDAMLQNEHCVNVGNVKSLRKVTGESIDFFNGKPNSSGDTFNPYSGWNTSLQNIFYSLIELYKDKQVGR